MQGQLPSTAREEPDALESTHPELVAHRCRDAQPGTGWRRGRCHDYQHEYAYWQHELRRQLS